MREIIVAGQFAFLVGLTILALTMLRQTDFALSRSIAAQKGPTLILDADCSSGIGQLMRDAPGVASATCGSEGAFNLGPQGAATIVNREGQRFTPGLLDVDPAYFPAMSLKPIAGRALTDGDAATRSIVINETAARQFGFASPQAAVGQEVGLSLEVGDAPRTDPSQIVGVVPDRPESVLVPANALVYQNFLQGQGVIAIEAPGYQFAPVHREIEAIWARVGDGGAPDLRLLSQIERERYRALVVQGRVAAGCAALALVIAMMGLFALSSLMVKQRRREIGLRKALGADTGAVTRLLAWQFTRPVLLAGLLALPLGYLAAARWLESYAARVNVPLWLLGAVFAGSASLAVATVLLHVFRVAGERPTVALRYE
jgi:putative ABC transport system permease protein